VFGVEAESAVVGVSGADDFLTTVAAGKVFFYFNEVLGHLR